jgi:hypothetical protein
VSASWLQWTSEQELTNHLNGRRRGHHVVRDHVGITKAALQRFNKIALAMTRAPLQSVSDKMTLDVALMI